MAEEEKPVPAPVSVPQTPVPISTVVSPQDIIKALLMGQPQASQAIQSAIQPEQAQEVEAAVPRPMMPHPALSDTQAKAGVQQLTVDSPKRPVRPPPFTKINPVNQIQPADVMKMYAHQLAPNVEAAKQRMLQALMQHTRGIAPPPVPTAKV
jgi:hypothetical protein